MREYFRSELVWWKMGLEEGMKVNLVMFSGGRSQALTLMMMDKGEIIFVYLVLPPDCSP